MVMTILVALSVLTISSFESIASTSATWRDPAQGRDIPVRVTYPTKGSRLPSIVFSHGFRGAENMMNPLVNYWAEHGYVVFQARHEDSIQNLSGRDKLQAFTTKRDANTFKSWRSRLKDQQFLYLVIKDVKPWVPELAGRLDTAKIGQAGHSFGAHTSQVLGGARLGRIDFSDLSPLAFCLISPQGINNLGITQDSWKSFTRPMMVISGTEDRSPLDDARTQADPTARQDPYKYSAPGDKYLLWIDGANHNFGGISGSFNWPGAGTSVPAHVDMVKVSALIFFDAYVKGDKAAKAKLEKGQFVNDFTGKVQLSSR